MSFPESYPNFYNQNDSIDQVFNKFPYPIDQIDQSITIPNTEEPGHSPIFRNKTAIHQLLTTPNPKTKTLFHLFEQNVAKFADNQFLGKRTSPNGGYEFITYREIQILRDQLGSGILSLMKQYSPAHINDFILSIYAPNRYEWSLIDYTCHAFSITSTALYDTLGSESIQYILQSTKTPILFTTFSKIEPILKLIQSDPSKFNLKFIISMDPISTIHNTTPIQIYTLQDLIQLGFQNPHPLIPPTPSTTFAITYTSGTSGTPKGVILTHSNIIASILSIYTKMAIEPNPKHFVFLPLPHILQRINLFLVSIKGGQVFFPHSDDSKTFFADILHVKPTHMASVPRVYNKLESVFKNKIYGGAGMVNKLVSWVIERRINGGRSSGMFDLLVHKKLRSIVGFDNVGYFVSGAAPIHGDTLRFIKAVFNVDVFVEAYGSTETCGGILFNSGLEINPGSVGSVSPTTEFRLQDVEEMGYVFGKNRTGELLVRGPQIFKGYFNDLENTQLAFDQNGWYKTGDVVKVDFSGKISIIDRRKNFFKLSQGEYIAPEKIENKYISNNIDLINQIWCYGDSYQSFLVGVIGIDLDNLKNFINKNEIDINLEDDLQIQQLFNDLPFKKSLLQHINSKVDDLQGFEKLKNIHIGIELLNVSNGTMTPTLKVKRFIAKNYFKHEINKLYQQGPLFESSKL